MADVVGVAEPSITDRPAAIRTIRRRSPLPNGRAVVGGFLVSVAALGVLVAWMEASREPDMLYVIANRDLTAGTVVQREDLAMAAMDLGSTTSRMAFTDSRQLVGTTVVARIGAGELVQPSDVVRRRASGRATEMSFSLDSDRALGGAIKPMERVDVIATFGSGPDSYTVAVVEGATVVDIAGEGNFAGGRDRVRLRLALASARDSLALAHAVNAGEVFVVRASEAEGRYSDPYKAPRAEEDVDR